MWSRGREVKMSDIHMIRFRGHGIVLHLIYHRITSPDLRLLPEKVWCMGSHETAADLSRLCTGAAE